MTTQMWILLVFAFAFGGIIGAGCIVRSSRRELNGIRTQRDKLTADMLDYQHQMRDQLLAHMSACTDNVRALYTARQEDATRYTKAMNASLQLVNEVQVAVSNAEAALKRLGPVSPAMGAELAVIRQLCNEMRTIMNGVTFDELARIVASLSEAERSEIAVYQLMAAHEQARAVQLDGLGE